jgi:hypothetical protein
MMQAGTVLAHACHALLVLVFNSCARRMLIQGFTLCVASATDIGDLKGYSARVCMLLDSLDALGYNEEEAPQSTPNCGAVSPAQDRGVGR